MDRQADVQTGIWTDRLMDRQADRITYIQTDGHIPHGQSYRQKNSH